MTKAGIACLGVSGDPIWLESIQWQSMEGLAVGWNWDHKTVIKSIVPGSDFPAPTPATYQPHVISFVFSRVTRSS